MVDAYSVKPVDLVAGLLRALQEREIDRVLRDAAGFRMGPFELFDLTGLDVSHPVMESIYRQYYDEPRYRPTVITAEAVPTVLGGKRMGGLSVRGACDALHGGKQGHRRKLRSVCPGNLCDKAQQQRDIAGTREAVVAVLDQRHLHIA